MMSNALLNCKITSQQWAAGKERSTGYETTSRSWRALTSAETRAATWRIKLTRYNLLYILLKNLESRSSKTTEEPWIRILNPISTRIPVFGPWAKTLDFQITVEDIPLHILMSDFDVIIMDQLFHKRSFILIGLYWGQRKRVPSALVQAISPISLIATHFSVAWSVCLSSVTFVALLKPCGGVPGPPR